MEILLEKRIGSQSEPFRIIESGEPCTGRWDFTYYQAYRLLQSYFTGDGWVHIGGREIYLGTPNLAKSKHNCLRLTKEWLEELVFAFCERFRLITFEREQLTAQTHRGFVHRDQASNQDIQAYQTKYHCFKIERELEKDVELRLVFGDCSLRHPSPPKGQSKPRGLISDYKYAYSFLGDNTMTDKKEDNMKTVLKTNIDLSKELQEAKDIANKAVHICLRGLGLNPKNADAWSTAAVSEERKNTGIKYAYFVGGLMVATIYTVQHLAKLYIEVETLDPNSREYEEYIARHRKRDL